MKVRQTLIRWMPLGGSFALFFNAVLAQNWVQTLLTFPALAASTAWAAYTESFLETWEELMRLRGDADANRLDQWLRSLNQGIQEAVQLIGFENQYLTCQANACRDDRAEGISSESFVPMLSEVFVPLELSDLFVRGQDGQQWPLSAGYQQDQAELLQLQEREGLQIWDLLKRLDQLPAYRQVVIKAWGGYGKTTLLRHLSFVYGKKRQKSYKAPQMIPVLIYLRDWQELLSSETPPNLATLITEQHLPSLPGGKKLNPPVSWVQNLLSRQQRRALVMLDGFDEVKATNRRAVSRWIGEQMQDFPEVVFLITSRPNAYKDDYVGKAPTAQLFVKPFNRKQQADFLNRWYFCQEVYARGGRKTPEVEQEAQKSAETLLEQLDQRPELQDLAKNPLLLNLIGTFHRFYPGQELPQRRGELYQEICKLQLGARPLAKRVAMPLPWEEIQEVLQGVALAMVKQELRTVPEKPLLRLLGQMLQRLETEQETEQETDRGADSGLDLAPGVAVEPAEFLRTVVRVSELLVEREAQEYEFSHLSFQNYLAALEVKRTKQEKLMLQGYDKPAWKEPILLYGAQMRNPAGLIRKLCEIGDQTAVDLAYTISQESTRKLGPDMEQELAQLAEQVQLFRFRDLENFLKNGEWKKADYETYRLMITAVGKEEGQAFEPEELLNFPWEELLKIDGLWRNYSNNRYGFSIQKEIYVKCGGKLDGSYPGDKLWTAFGKEVGWHVNDRWLGYSDLEWGGTGVLGHLPCGRFGGGGLRERFGSLFSRIETCEV